MIRGKDRGEEVLLVEQHTLARALQRLGAQLSRHQHVDPVRTTQISLVVLATIREWLESGMVLGAMEEVGRETLEQWDEELGEIGAYLAAVREHIHRELTLSLKERNRRPIGNGGLTIVETFSQEG